MTGPTRRFDPGELAGDGATPPSDAEAAGLLGMARELEDVARSEPASMSAGFEDRVMAAVRLAPSPAAAAAAGAGLGGFFGRVGLAWRDLWGGGRPMVVRAQAFALLLIVAVAATSVGTLATVGVARLLDPGPTPPPTIPEPSPSGPPSVTAIPSLSPSPSTTPSAVPTPSPTPFVAPSPSSTPARTSEPTASPGSTDGGGGATASPPPTGTARPTGTPKPTATPHATHTPDPTETADPTKTPDPTNTPDPTEDGTPDPTNSSGSGSGGDDSGAPVG